MSVKIVIKLDKNRSQKRTYNIRNQFKRQIFSGKRSAHKQFD